MKTTLLFLLALLFLAGCSLVDNDDNPSRMALELNRSQWRAQGFSSYQYDLLISCFCQYVGPVRVLVRGDSVHALTPHDTADVPFTPEDLAPDYALTIDDLFDIVGKALGQADELEVDYDAALGYPTRISIDWDDRAVDDEIAYRATNLTPLR